MSEANKKDQSGRREQAAISDDLLQLLVCPVDKQALRLEGSTLTCTVCERHYPIEDGIPQMLVDRTD